MYLIRNCNSQSVQQYLYFCRNIIRVIIDSIDIINKDIMILHQFETFTQISSYTESVQSIVVSFVLYL